MSDLKPCPFCGGEARYYIDNKYADCHQIICTKCAVTKSYEDYEFVIRDWNNRASGWVSVEDGLPEEYEEVLVFIIVGGYEKYREVSFVENGVFQLHSPEDLDCIVSWKYLGDFPDHKYIDEFTGEEVLHVGKV